MTFATSDTLEVLLALGLGAVFILFIIAAGLLVTSFAALYTLATKIYQQSLATHTLTTTALVEAIHSLRADFGPKLPAEVSKQAMILLLPPLPEDKLKAAVVEGTDLADHAADVALKGPDKDKGRLTRHDKQRIAYEHILSVARREFCNVEAPERTRFARAIEINLAAR